MENWTRLSSGTGWENWDSEYCGNDVFPHLPFPLPALDLAISEFPTASSLHQFCHFRSRSGNKEAKEVQEAGRLCSWTLVMEGFLALDKMKGNTVGLGRMKGGGGESDSRQIILREERTGRRNGGFIGFC